MHQGEETWEGWSLAETTGMARTGPREPGALMFRDTVQTFSSRECAASTRRAPQNGFPRRRDIKLRKEKSQLFLRGRTSTNSEFLRTFTHGTGRYFPRSHGLDRASGASSYHERRKKSPPRQTCQDEYGSLASATAFSRTRKRIEHWNVATDGTQS